MVEVVKLYTKNDKWFRTEVERFDANEMMSLW